MLPRRRMLLLLISATLALGGGLVVNSSDPSTAGATPPFQMHPMVGLSTEELRQYVLDYTRRYYPSRSGTPEVLLLRFPVTNADLRDLRLPMVTFACEAPPLTLAIVRGDFVVKSYPGAGMVGSSGRKTQFRYLSFVFDMWKGGPTLWGLHPAGEGLRTALKDPSLPLVASDIDEPPPLPPPPTGPVCKYGSVARGYPRPPTSGNGK